MKFFGLMPCQKVMEIAAVQSLIGMQADIYNKGDGFKIAFTNGHNPVLSRVSLFRHAAKEEGVDYVLCMDSDHVYKAKHLYALVDKMNEHNLDMLSAGYLVRGPFKTFAHGKFEEDGTFSKLEKDDCSGITDCDVLGFGFYLFRHEFVKKIVEKHGKDLFHMDYADNSTEDVYFCRKMKADGHRICFDADNIVGHLSTWVNR